MKSAKRQRVRVSAQANHTESRGPGREWPGRSREDHLLASVHGWPRAASCWFLWLLGCNEWWPSVTEPKIFNSCSLSIFKFGKSTRSKSLLNKAKVYEIRRSQKAATIKRLRGSHTCFGSLWSGGSNEVGEEGRERGVWYKRLRAASDGFVLVSGEHEGDMNRCQVMEGLICHEDTLQGFRKGSQGGRYTF